MDAWDSLHSLHVLVEYPVIAGLLLCTSPSAGHCRILQPQRQTVWFVIVNRKQAQMEVLNVSLHILTRAVFEV